ncbi:hypothetical protein B0H13DRAFT_2302729 [Mycena leptocephala]|nr:hypothetical protein B0H13DRAFT_2302729 [Mycena leptocephala]
MSSIDLVTTILVKPNVYPANDKRGTKKLFAWFERPGMDHLIHDIHAEMDLLSEIFRFATSEVIPESLCDFDFERDVTEVCRERTPKLRRILLAAAQTHRAARENKKKNYEPECSFFTSELANSLIARDDDSGSISKNTLPKQ